MSVDWSLRFETFRLRIEAAIDTGDYERAGELASEEEVWLYGRYLYCWRDPDSPAFQVNDFLARLVASWPWLHRMHLTTVLLRHIDRHANRHKIDKALRQLGESYVRARAVQEAPAGAQGRVEST